MLPRHAVLGGLGSGALFASHPQVAGILIQFVFLVGAVSCAIPTPAPSSHLAAACVVFVSLCHVVPLASWCLLHF